MTRILIPDDHAVVRTGLRLVIADQPGWSVVAEASNGIDAIAQAIATKPDVAILDYSMPLMNGVEATRQIRRRVPSVEVLIFTMHDDKNVLREMLAAGARGYLLNSDAPQHLMAAIQSLAAHRPFLTGEACEMLLETFLTQVRRIDRPLTDRQQAIVQLAAEGHRRTSVYGGGPRVVRPL
jgi:DNA-binding NarL/FixJ family response regulator